MENGLRTSDHRSKRQKTIPAPSSANKPLSSKSPKIFKQSVSSKRPKILKEDPFGPNVTLRKPISNGIPGAVPREHDDLMAEEHAIDELGDDQDGVMTATPTKSHSSAHRRLAAKVQVVTGTGTVGNTTKARNESPSRKAKKKYRGWEYLKEGEDVGINNQDAFAKIAEEAAKEAAEAKAHGEDLATVSAKSLRERKKKVSPEPVKKKDERIEHTRKTVQKRKREGEHGPSQRNSRGVEAGDRSFGVHDLSMQDESDDELHIDKPFGETVTAVRVKTPKNNKSTPKEAYRTQSKDIMDLGSTWTAPTKQLSQGIFTRQSTTPKMSIDSMSIDSMSIDSQSISAQQLEVSMDISRKDFSTAASHLQSLVSRYPSALSSIKAQLLLQLTSNRCLAVLPPHLLTEYETLYQLLSRTVQAGEGNSMLIIGSRGSGKSALVERAITDLTCSNRADFHVVRLNGFIHTDDKLALREIWRQLGRDLEGNDEDVSSRTNYADTLTSLLALLSHQDESQEEGGEQTSAARSVIFVLDEFDLFAQHSRQTLLYNLFDVAQSHRNAPIAVLGLTTKLNVIDSLEKRVKSRFAQRSVYVSLPKSFKAYKAVCLEALTYHSSSVSSLEEEIESLPEDVVRAWNAYANALLSTPCLTEALHAHYATTNRPKDFQTAVALPFLYALNSPNLSSIPQLPSYTILSPPDSVLALLPTLSTLELSLLIAACRLDIILSTEICSFDMAYEELTKLVSKSKVQMSASGQMVSGSGPRIWSRQVARWAWQALASVGLIVPAASGGGSGSQDRDGSWSADVSVEELGAWRRQRGS